MRAILTLLSISWFVADIGWAREEPIAFIPEMENVRLGMDLKEFLLARPNVRSGNPEPWLPFPDEKPKNWKDPSDPKNPDFSAKSHSFDEDIPQNPILNQIGFYFHQQKLTFIDGYAMSDNFLKTYEMRR